MWIGGRKGRIGAPGHFKVVTTCKRYLASPQGRSEVHAAHVLNDPPWLESDGVNSSGNSSFLHVLRTVVLVGQFLIEGRSMRPDEAGSGSRRTGSSRVSKPPQVYRLQRLSWREVCREAVPEMSGPHWAVVSFQPSVSRFHFKLTAS